MTAADGRAIGYILLYGSLRRGQANFARMGLQQALRFVRTVRFAGVMYDLGDYPGVVEGDGEVTGELFAILDPGVVARLDLFEMYRPDDPAPYDPTTGRGSLYLRKPLKTGRTTAYCYLYNGPDDTLTTPVPSGDWVRRRGF